MDKWDTSRNRIYVNSIEVSKIAFGFHLTGIFMFGFLAAFYVAPIFSSALCGCNYVVHIPRISTLFSVDR